MAATLELVVIIPHGELSPETLDNLISEFVTRDGTDYGEQETPLASRIGQVRQLLQRGQVVILFSESTGLCNIVAKDQLEK
ncbi:YheU family protein [Marinobacterium aestuarii]|uniref:YheU family protein n=1 Tax=Marinobacterium aestuarii TaxID=1821621 RepID=UPI000A046BA7